MTFEDTLTIATKHLRDHSAWLLDQGDITGSIAADDAIRELDDGVKRLNQRVSVLCPALLELVETATAIDPPPGCQIFVSTLPDVYVERPDGHWVGFRTGVSAGADGQPTQIWLAWRTSAPIASPVRFGTLQEVVDYYGEVEV